MMQHTNKTRVEGSDLLPNNWSWRYGGIT